MDYKHLPFKSADKLFWERFISILAWFILIKRCFLSKYHNHLKWNDYLHVNELQNSVFVWIVLRISSMKRYVVISDSLNFILWMKELRYMTSGLYYSVQCNFWRFPHCKKKKKKKHVGCLQSRIKDDNFTW